MLMLHGCAGAEGADEHGNSMWKLSSEAVPVGSNITSAGSVQQGAGMQALSEEPQPVKADSSLRGTNASDTNAQADATDRVNAQQQDVPMHATSGSGAET